MRPMPLAYALGLALLALSLSEGGRLLGGAEGLFGGLLALAGLVALDAYLALRGVDLLAREHDAAVVVGHPLELRWRVRNRRRARVRLVLQDENPPELQACAPGPVELRIAPRGEATGRATIAPTDRGSCRIPATWMEARGPLGLARGLRRHAVATTLDVHSDLRPFALLRRRRGGLPQPVGSRGRARRGAGQDIGHLREYLPGDEVRRIDWKATARRQRPITREPGPELHRQVFLAVDCGRWMGGVTPTRLDAGLDGLFLLAATALQAGDKVGAMAYDEGVRLDVPPRAGRPARRLLVDQLHPLRPRPVESDHALALAALGARLRRRSLVVVVADFDLAEDDVEVVRAVQLLARRHELHLVHLLDREEEALAGAFPRDLPALAERTVAERSRAARLRGLDRLAAAGARVRPTRIAELGPVLLSCWAGPLGAAKPRG